MIKQTHDEHHTCARGTIGGTPFVASLAGPERKIRVGKTVYTFEDHRYHGPYPLDSRGNAKELGPRSPFWTAVTCWYQTGKQIDADGFCVWRPEPDPTEDMVRVGRNYYPRSTVARLMPQVLAKLNQREAKR